MYGDIKKESRSDVNLIATVNPKTHKILLTTTPRDYYVPIPGVSDGQRDKLTHAGIYGIDTSIATLEELYDIDIPFYVRVNFTSVEEIVDVMGGVDVESELAFTTGEEAGAIVEVKQGKNHFTGKEALAFVRERKALAEGDNQRGKNQQALLTGLIRSCLLYTSIQVLTPMRKGLLGVERLNRILQEYLNPPAKDKKEKVAVLEELKNETRTIIIYEAPHRLSLIHIFFIY